MINKFIPITLALTVLLSIAAYGEDTKTVEQLMAESAKIQKSIDLTKSKMKEIKDVAFLPDLYFVMAELYVEKSRYEYTITRQKNPNAPINELDFSDAKKSKKQAVDIYQRIIENFPKGNSVDKALFYMAHEYRELGDYENMVKTYNKLTTDFPKSDFWEESILILADFYYETKKDIDLAFKHYQKILNRPQNPFMPIARYKSGWCYINMQKFHDALLAFEAVLNIDSKIPQTVLDKLPDVYRKSDIRRDALVAMVWPYSEEKKLDPERKDALNYFENLSPSRPTLMKVLDKLAKRLMIKNRFDEALPAYYRLLEITHDLERQSELLDRFYEAFKKSQKYWPLDMVARQAAHTLIRMRGSVAIPQADKVKAEKNYEIYLRDYSTRLQKTAKATQKPVDYDNAIHAYEDYLMLFPNSKYFNAIMLNLAESYFAIKKTSQAGMVYEKLYVRTKKTKKEYIDSSIQSYALTLKTPDKFSKLEVAESREGFRDVGAFFAKSYPQDPANAMIYFNIARTYYDEREFEKAARSFMSFINLFPNHKEATTAGNLILDSYNQREDYDGLVKAGKALIANARLNNPQFKKDVGEIVKQAEYRKLQNVAGDPKSRDYAQKLLSFASKYQGSSLGDQALYEAFVSLKAKKDPSAYDPGEQLLKKHADSRYAKEVVGAMGQMALNSADYRRASQYFEFFARKFPKEPTSPGLLKNAASMRELMGDFKEAAEDFRDLGPGMSENVARQFALAQDWSSLSQALAARPVPGLKGQYWMGLALYRQGQLQQSKPYLAQAARSSASAFDEKKMAAHSLYLLSTEALKDYQSIQLGAGKNEAQLVKVKNDKLSQLTAQFNKVISYGNGRWVIAALYQLGRANNEFAQFINGAAMPAGLNPAQQSQYKQLIAQQSQTFKQKAAGYFNSCVQNAEKFEVFTNFVKGCLSQGATEVDEAAEERTLAKAADSAPTEATAIRRKLLDTPRDVKLLNDLAQTYIRAQDYSLARVIQSRALEVSPNNASVEAQLGYTLIFMNDLETAQASFKQALKHNPKDPTALWGLAALYKQFGYQAKFASTLARAKGSGRPVGQLPPQVAQILTR